MATFAELLTDVYTATNRPDLVAQSTLAVKVATLKAHQTDFYPKDIYETGIQWNPVGYTQSLSYRTLVPRWRALKYLRKFDYTTPPGESGEFFTVLTPEQVLDDYSINKENVCYLAGEQLEIRSADEDEYMLLGCYIQPNLDEANYESWIALDHPYCIVYMAAQKVLNDIGFDEQARRLDKEVAEQVALLKMSNILANGY